MRRRSFLAALPLAAVAGTAFTQTATPKRADAPAADGAPQPGFQSADAVRFERPGVHPGDRQVGAGFASRSAALGVSGAAGSAHPLATLTAMEILAARRVGWRLRSTRINRWRTNDGDGFNGAASKMRADAVALAY